ncbi:E3 ubiquitin-protein ligase RNF183 [Stigmatopora argus]
MSEERERRRSRRNRSREPRLPPNVKPRVDTRRPPKSSRPPRSRSTESERARRPGEPSQPRRQNRQRRGRSADSGERRRRGEENRRPAQAEASAGDDGEEPECAICFCSYDNIFKTPKLLACGHTFCLECLARINVSAPQLKTLSCPVCRELTDIPHGQDLPRLDNNQDIIGRLPPEMRRARSVRFKRSKGKLLLKNPGNATAGASSSSAAAAGLTLPRKTRAPAADTLGLREVEDGGRPAAVVDVGRPPNRVRGRIRRFFRSDRCYYISVASVVTIALVLLLVGILAFVIVPNATPPRPPPGNRTAQTSSPPNSLPAGL